MCESKKSVSTVAKLSFLMDIGDWTYRDGNRITEALIEMPSNKKQRLLQVSLGTLPTRAVTQFIQKYLHFEQTSFKKDVT